MLLALQLPGGIKEKLSFLSDVSVKTLKETVEILYGIPFEMQHLEYNGIQLIDDAEVIATGALVTVGVDLWWNKLVSLCLQGNSASLHRRVSVPMQQVAEGNRAFVSLFISATRGHPSSLTNIFSVNKDFDISTSTLVTGRTVLHAAVNSGSLKCVEIVKKHAGLQFEKLLCLKDKLGRNAISYLSHDNLRMLNYINKFLSDPVSVDDIPSGSERKVEVVTNSEDIHNENLNTNHLNRPNAHDKEEHIKKTLDRDTNDCNVLQEIDKQQEVHKNKKSVRNEDLQHGAKHDKQNERIRQPQKDDKKKNETIPFPQRHTKVPSHIDGSRVETQPSGIARAKSEIRNPNPNLLPEKITAQSKNGGVQTSVSPIYIEKKDNTSYLRVGKAVSENKTDKNKLPSVRVTTAAVVAADATDKSKQNHTPFPVPSFPRQPRPPVLDKKKRPVPGVLKESSARKFSAANRHIHSSSDSNSTLSVQNHVLPSRPVSADFPRKTTQPKLDEEKPSTAGKVRRISRIQAPQRSPEIAVPANDLSRSASPEPHVIEIEKDRIDKPWNSWIKAVTVDAESEEAKHLTENPVQEQVKSRKTSLQVARDPNRKISFDQWVFHKEQEHVVVLQKLRDESKHTEANEAEAKWKNGKSFEKWKAEKEEYEHLLKEQHEQDEKENRPKRQYLKGKTFEQWQRDTEEKEKLDAETKSMQHAQQKVQKEVAEQKRRKESSAKYEQWLLAKEMQEMLELEKELHQTKRKPSKAKSFTDVKGRKRSMPAATKHRTP